VSTDAVVKLAWTKAELPAALRDLPNELWKVAKGIYNGHLLSATDGDPVENTLAEMRRRGMIQ
jgi:hypothetical protein